MDPVTIFTAFIPLVQHGVKAVINKISGGAGVKPATVAEAVQLGELDIRRIEAIANLDTVSGAAQWVSNVRGVQRPAAVGVVLLTYLFCILTPTVDAQTVELVSNLASSAMFYLFGDRTLMYLNGRKGGNQ